MAKLAALLWLLNPLPMVVSSRGNAESVMAYLVLQTILFLHRRQLILGAIMYALAVHVKIYPITYAPVLYLYLGTSYRLHKANIASSLTVKQSWRHSVIYFLRSLLPTRERIYFCVVAATTLVLLTAIFYAQYVFFCFLFLVLLLFFTAK
jgi:phosphatidylinositol glycan class M